LERCTEHRSQSLPALWSFAEMDRQEPERAARLRNAPPWSELTQRVCDALRDAILAGHVRYGFDESSRDSGELRAVVQFPIGRELFDYFFNGHTGYRAQFRIGRENGTAQNAVLVSKLASELSRFVTGPLSARRLSHEFSDMGPLTAAADELALSLEPHLSKVWLCDKLIGKGDGVQPLFVSRSGPELTFPDSDPWKSLYAEDADGWLDMKGAFVGHAGQYQLKSPNERAANLEKRGSA
jgi:hypothetical protein